MSDKFIAQQNELDEGSAWEIVTQGGERIAGVGDEKTAKQCAEELNAVCDRYANIASQYF